MTPEKRTKSVRNWIASAEYDFTTAEHMLQTGRYLYVIFMCHLAIEKMLKAHVELHENKFPPKIHSLTSLIERAGLDIPVEFKKIILELNASSIPTRYPEDLKRSLRVHNKQKCKSALAATKETLQWLKSHSRFAKL